MTDTLNLPDNPSELLELAQGVLLDVPNTSTRGALDHILVKLAELGGSGVGALRVADRSDTNNPAVFSTFAELETYTATPSGTADATRINVDNANQAQEAFVLGTLNAQNQVTDITAAYVRVNNAWVAVTAIFAGTPGRNGADGLALEFSSEAGRDAFFTSRPELLVPGLPILVTTGENTVTLQTWDGANRPSSYTSAMASDWANATLIVGTGSLLLGSSLSLSNAQQTIAVGLPGNRRAMAVVHEYNDNGSLALQTFSFAAEQTLVINPIATQAIPAPFTLNFSTFGDNLTVNFDFIPAEAGELRVRFYDGTDNTAPVIFDETRTVTQAEVDAAQFVEFGVGNPYILPQNTGIFVEFSGIQLMGGTVTDPNSPLVGQTIIAFRSSVLPYTMEQIALAKDIFNYSDRMVEVGTSININSSNVATYDRQLILVPSTAASPVTITISDDVELEGFDFVNASNVLLTIQRMTGGSVTINGITEVNILGQWAAGRLVTLPGVDNAYYFAAQSFNPPFQDRFLSTLSASLNGNELTIQGIRTGGLSVLSTTVDLQSIAGGGGGGTTPVHEAQITRFDIQGQANSVAAGFVLSGSQTFNFNVQHPEDINGNLSLLQDGTVLRSDIDPAGSTTTATVTDNTITDNETVTFTLRGARQGGGTISRTFVIRGHAPAESIYYGLSDSNNPADVVITGFDTHEANVDNTRIDTGAVTDGQYFIILVPHNEDLHRITDGLGQDVTAIFTRTADVRSLNGIQYVSYVIGALNASDSESYILEF